MCEDCWKIKVILIWCVHIFWYSLHLPLIIFMYLKFIWSSISLSDSAHTMIFCPIIYHGYASKLKFIISNKSTVMIFRWKREIKYDSHSNTSHYRISHFTLVAQRSNMNNDPPLPDLFVLEDPCFVGRATSLFQCKASHLARRPSIFWHAQIHFWTESRAALTFRF